MAEVSQHIQEEQILKTLVAFPGGISAKGLLKATRLKISERTLVRRLTKLVNEGRVGSQGQTNRQQYFPIETDPKIVTKPIDREEIPLSKAGKEILNLMQQPAASRKPVGYNLTFLDHYLPNRTAYLSSSERKKLAELGNTNTAGAPAGTYARQILGRLLIDLSWNSSRLEGNTYSLLDTQRLLAEGATPLEKSDMETQMILNHKDAIEFIVENADSAIGFNRYTITGLHAILSNNLLPDPAASGRLRTFAVGIGNSAYSPTAIPQLIEELVEIILQKASDIDNPFEQAFFVMAHLSYLQPFDDVNKRVSRLAVNIPLNCHNLAPLTFTEVPQNLYIAGLLGIYELNNIALLKDVFIWAYERSAARYAALRQTMGEPNPFRLQYRDQIRTLIKYVIVNALTPAQTSEWINSFAVEIPESDRQKFIEVVDEELLSLHDRNFARYMVTPSQFSGWKKIWDSTFSDKS